MNIQALKHKTVDLYQELTRYDYDFVVLSETWLKPSISNHLLVFPGYAVKLPTVHSSPTVIVVSQSYSTILMFINLSRSPLQTTQPANLNLYGHCLLDTNRRLIIAVLCRPPRRTVAALDAGFFLHRAFL